MVLAQAIVRVLLSQQPAVLSTVEDRVVRGRRAVDGCRVEEMEVGLRDDRFREFLRPYVVGRPAYSVFLATVILLLVLSKGPGSTVNDAVSRCALCMRDAVVTRYEVFCEVCG